MASSTARAWSKANEVVFGSTDPRFQGGDIVAVVMDITNQEWRLYDNIAKSPGIISPDHIVGIIKNDEE